MANPRDDDYLLMAMYEDTEYQNLISRSDVSELDFDEFPLMEEKGTKFIRDFMTLQGIPKDDAKTLNDFMMKFYLGTSRLSYDHQTYADEIKPWEEGLDWDHYVQRLAKVIRWLKDEKNCKAYEEACDKIANFCLLSDNPHARFVDKRMMQMTSWFRAARQVEVKTYEDVSKINVAVIGGRYAVQQIWVAAEQHLKDARRLRAKAGSFDGLRDENIIP